MARPKSINALQGAAGAIRNLTKSVKSTMQQQHSILPNRETAGVMAVSLESYEALGANPADIESTLETVKGSLTDALAGVDEAVAAVDGEAGGAEGIVAGAAAPFREHQSDVAIEAAAVLAMSYNDPKAYYRDEYSTPSFEAGVRVNDMVSSGRFGSIATLGEKSRPSFESFDEKETEKWREHSYAINLIVAKQHEFAELFYRTYIVTPDQAGFLMSIRRNQVWEGWSGTDLSGAQQPLVRRNILQGLLDHTILETNSTELIPAIQKGDNDAWFISESLLAPQTVKQNNEEFQTNYLAFGVDGFNLLQLSQTPSRLKKGGSPNFTDSLDSRVALKELLISVGKGGTKELIALDVNRDQFAQYVAAREGNFRQMELIFRSTLGLGEDVKLLDGSESTFLKPLFEAGYRLELSVKINGDLNVEIGNGSTWLNQLAIAKVFDRTGKEVSLNDAAVSQLLTGITVNGEGYSLESRLTNYNQLEMGLIVDSNVERNGFLIPILPPLMIIKPALMDDEKVYPKLEALTTAYRLQMRNAAVTTLLNRADTLKQYLGVNTPHPIESNLGLEGLGQYYIRPYYNEVDIDVLDELNNLTSNAKQSDIQGLIVTRINNLIYTADQLTGYTGALEAAFPGRSPKPHVAIGTDMRLPQYIQVPGDDRTVGIGYDFTIARISDLRMKDKIVMTFVLPNESEPHPLQHGVLGFIPEYLVKFNMIRQQRIADEMRLTPRYRYFNFLPLMLVINVKNLDEAIATRTQVDVDVVNAGEFPGDGAGS